MARHQPHLLVTLPAPGDRVGLDYATWFHCPEGGFAPGEIADGVVRWDPGDTVPRVETAAIAGAVLLRASHGKTSQVDRRVANDQQVIQ